MIKILLDLNIPLLYPLKLLLRNHNSSFEKSKNILFFTRNLGLGDSVLLLPLVKKLKENDRSFNFYFYFQMGRGKFHAKSILGCEVIENNAELKKMAFFKIYDLILEELFFSQIKIRKLQTNHFVGLNFGFKKWLYDEVKTRGKSKHVIDLWCNLLEHPLSYQSKKKSLQTLSYMSEPFNLQMKEKLILISPFSNVINGVHLGADKSWGLENFFELAKIFYKEYNAKIFFVGIIDCEKMFREIAPDFERYGINYFGKTTITQFLYLIKSSSMTVSNNTAMVHLSNALNVPNFNFQGNVNLVQWHPYIKENLFYIFNHLNANDFYHHYEKQISKLLS